MDDAHISGLGDWLSSSAFHWTVIVFLRLYVGNKQLLKNSHLLYSMVICSNKTVPGSMIMQLGVAAMKSFNYLVFVSVLTGSWLTLLAAMT